MRLPIVKDRIAWSVGLSVGLSPSEPCKNSCSDRDVVCVDDSGGPKETPVAYSGLLRANNVLRLFNTIQPSSYRLDLQSIYSSMLFVQYDQGELSTSCMKLVLESPVIRQ